jgi:hypothetical protein
MKNIDTTSDRFLWWFGAAFLALFTAMAIGILAVNPSPARGEPLAINVAPDGRSLIPNQPAEFRLVQQGDKAFVIAAVISEGRPKITDFTILFPSPAAKSSAAAPVAPASPAKTAAICPGGVCPVPPPPAMLELRVPVQAEVREKVKATVRRTTKKIKAIVGYNPGACPTCPPVAIWGEVEVPLTPEELAAEALVDKFAAGTLTEEEVLAAKAAGLREEVRKVVGQRWSVATCGMVCLSHGSQLYLLFNDGSQELAPSDQQPVIGADSSGGFRLFRRRR